MRHQQTIVTRSHASPFVAAFFLLTVMSQPGAGQVSRREVRAQCSPAAFGRALTLDARRLRQQQRTELTQDAAEGSTVTVLYQGAIPRIIRFTDLGESGRSEKSVYLLDSLNYIVWTTELTYDRAISPQRHPVIATREAGVFLVCGGKAQAGSGDDVTDLIERVGKVMKATNEKD